MVTGARPREKKMLGEEVLRACRAAGDTERLDDSATTMGRAYSKYSGGRSCFIHVVWERREGRITR